MFGLVVLVVRIDPPVVAVLGAIATANLKARGAVWVFAG